MANLPVPRLLWRFALVGLGMLLLAGSTGALLLALGAADVPPLGSLRWLQEAASGGCLDASILDLPAISPPVTLELTVVGNAAFAVWGLWLESSAADLRWAVLPPGYYRRAGQTIPFLHIRAQENTLRLDITASNYVLWFNHEQAEVGALTRLGGAWGLHFDGDVCWRRAAVYARNPLDLTN